MILRCVVCGSERHAHNSSASVQDSLCAVHSRSPTARRFYERRQLQHEPVKTFTEALTLQYKRRPKFYTHSVTTQQIA